MRAALGGESMVHLFARADSDEDGYLLSYAETKAVLEQLVAACGGNSEVGPADLDDLVELIDGDNVRRSGA